MKLNRHIKSFIVSSIYETGIIELKLLLELYGSDQTNRALKIIDYIRAKKGLILKKMYSNCTKVYSNYYKYNVFQLNNHGYIKSGSFYIFRDFATIA